VRPAHTAYVLLACSTTRQQCDCKQKGNGSFSFLDLLWKKIGRVGQILHVHAQSYRCLVSRCQIGPIIMKVLDKLKILVGCIAASHLHVNSHWLESCTCADVGRFPRPWPSGDPRTPTMHERCLTLATWWHTFRRWDFKRGNTWTQ